MNYHEQYLSNHHSDEGNLPRAPEYSSEPLPISTYSFLIISNHYANFYCKHFLSYFTTSPCIPKQYCLVLPDFFRLYINKIIQYILYMASYTQNHICEIQLCHCVLL